MPPTCENISISPTLPDYNSTQWYQIKKNFTNFTSGKCRKPPKMYLTGAKIIAVDRKPIIHTA